MAGGASEAMSRESQGGSRRRTSNVSALTGRLDSPTRGSVLLTAETLARDVAGGASGRTSVSRASGGQRQRRRVEEGRRQAAVPGRDPVLSI